LQGIVTDFTMTAFPQTEVWVRAVLLVIVHLQCVNPLFQGGLIAYSTDKSNEVRAAIADFSANAQDPKAAIVSSFANGQGIGVIIFYDAPTAPPGIFDSFTNIPSVLNNLKTRSYLDMILVATLALPLISGDSLRKLLIGRFADPLL
jgi:hypothetical protein